MFWYAIRVPAVLNNAGSRAFDVDAGLVTVTVAILLVLFTKTSGTRPAAPAPTGATAVLVVRFKVIVAGVTVNVPWLEVMLPAEFVTTTRYLLPDMAVVTFASVNVALVAPFMLNHVLPALVDTCHWNVGAGGPMAVTLKVVVCPAITVRFGGWAVIMGRHAVFTVTFLATFPPVPTKNV